MAQRPDLGPQLAGFLAACEGESDRGIALLSGEHVHSSLTDLLSVVLVKSSYRKAALRHDGLLGDFDAKIKLAYLLGLMTKNVRGYIEALQGIRNQAGHSREPFDLGRTSTKVQELLDQLPAIEAPPRKVDDLEIPVTASSDPVRYNRWRIGSMSIGIARFLDLARECIEAVGGFEPAELVSILGRSRRAWVQERLEEIEEEKRRALSEIEEERRRLQTDALGERVMREIDPSLAASDAGSSAQLTASDPKPSE